MTKPRRLINGLTAWQGRFAWRRFSFLIELQAWLRGGNVLTTALLHFKESLIKPGVKVQIKAKGFSIINQSSTLELSRRICLPTVFSHCY